MACPVIHKTPEAKLAAAREKRRRYYAKNREIILKRRRELHTPKHDTKESQKESALHGPTSDEDSGSESSEPDQEINSSDDIDLSDLPQCLVALKIIKDEMLALTQTEDPGAFVQGVFQEYVKTLDNSTKGDVTILDMPLATVQGLLDCVIPIQDEILNFCGISPEWRAVDSVSRFLRTILAYLEDILCFATDVCDQLDEAIASGSVVTKAKRLNTLKKLTKEAYENAHPEVKALCLAKVQEEHMTKASELLNPRTRERTNAELAKALEECTGPIAHFLQAIHEMTGFHWTVMGAGPDPRHNGDINVMSYHTGTNEYGQNWKQATPDFDDKHLKPYVAFISSLFCEFTSFFFPIIDLYNEAEHIRKTRAADYVLPTPSSTLGTEANPIAGESQSSNTSQNLPSTSALIHSPRLLPGTAQTPIPAPTWYPTQHPDELISWDDGFDFGGSGDFGMPGFQNPSGASIMNVSMPSLSLSPLIPPTSLYTSPPRLRPQLSTTGFASSTPPSDSPAPFFTSPAFTFPTLPAPIPTHEPSTSAPSDSPAPFFTPPSFIFPTLPAPISTPNYSNSTAPASSTAISVRVSHSDAAVYGQSLSNLVDTAENNTADASIEVLDTSGMGTPDATAVEAAATRRVDVNNDMTTTSSKPKGRPTTGKHMRQVPTDSEIPSDSNGMQPVRKTGRIRTETTQLMQANNIGQNLKRPQHTKPHSKRPKKK
ncbi:hypothetical protein EDD22DRAFT_959037 [Suillus occidentalis]|nr:hypothetical protein EDD22DRAFT_959037 [Suillus occidentalis]